MPARSPAVEASVASRLSALGGRIRAQRKRYRVSAITAAEAAGLSRVTLHRIERGEPSVTMGAYMNAANALGLVLELTEAQGRDRSKSVEPGLHTVIRLSDYPQLQRLAWQLDESTELTPGEALDLYERNWRHVDAQHMEAHERSLLDSLVAAQGGRLLV